MTEPKLLSQSLTIVDKWQEIVKNLDIRNAIMWYLAHFTHKNSNVDANRIRTLPTDQDTVIKLIEELRSSDEELKDRINMALQNLQDQELKGQIEEVLRTNNKFEIDVEDREVDHPTRNIKDERGYVRIYKSLGRSKDDIYIKMITRKDLGKPVKNNILNGKRIKLWMIKATDTESKYEVCLTLIVSILFGSGYKIRESLNDDLMERVIVEFVPNVLEDRISGIGARNIIESSLIKTIIVNTIMVNEDDNPGNVLIDTSKKAIPIDFDIEYIIKFDLKSNLESIDNELFKNFTRRKQGLVVTRYIAICKYLIGELPYEDLLLEFDKALEYWGERRSGSNYNFSLEEKEFNLILREVLNPEKFKSINDVKKDFQNDPDYSNGEEVRKILSLFENLETFYDLLQKHKIETQPSASISGIKDMNTNETAVQNPSST